MGVTHALGLDVASGDDEPFHEELVQVTAGHGVTGTEGLEVLLGPDDLDTAAAASVGALQHDRVAVGLDEVLDLVHGLDRVGGAGDRGDTGDQGGAAGADLVAELADGVGRGADPGQAGVGDGLGSLGDLGEEAVSGVDGVGAGTLGNVDDLGGVEVGLLQG